MGMWPEMSYCHCSCEGSDPEAQQRPLLQRLLPVRVLPAGPAVHWRSLCVHGSPQLLGQGALADWHVRRVAAPWHCAGGQQG